MVHIWEMAAGERICVLVLAVLVDLLVGDPQWLWHPVQGIGLLIRVLEDALRRLFQIPQEEVQVPQEEVPDPEKKDPGLEAEYTAPQDIGKPGISCKKSCRGEKHTAPQDTGKPGICSKTGCREDMRIIEVKS